MDNDYDTKLARKAFTIEALANIYEEVSIEKHMVRPHYRHYCKDIDC